MYEGLKNLDVPRPRRAPGTGAPGGPTHPRRRKLLKLLVTGVVVGALLMGAVGGYTYWKVKDNLKRGVVDIGELAKAAPGEPLNILVVGSDSRKGVTKKDRKKGLGGPGGRRADVIMILHIAGKDKGPRRSATLLSIPRDLRVPIPGHGTNKINAAYAFGGLRLLKRTVEEFTDIPLNHFLEVNFFGFRGIVNQVGGVAVRVPDEIHDDKAKLDIPHRGCWILNGDQALGYVRARQFDPTADIGRISRQQGFLRALAARMRAKSVLLSPKTVLGISKNVGEYFQYDEGLVGGTTFETARAIAAQLATFDTRKLDFRIVPNYPQYIGGVSYLIPYDQDSTRLFRALQEDRPIPYVGLTAQSVPRRQDVTVTIYNGTKTAGLAAKVSAKLAKKSFDVGTPSNGDRRARTLIVYDEGDDLKADLVRTFFPGARMQRSAEDVPGDVLVYLGRDRLTESPAPVPTAAAPPPQQNCKRLPA